MIRGKIVLVPFPFDDLSTTKVRLALCLTDRIGPHRHIVLAFISGRIPPDLLDTDMVLDSADPNFQVTGLLHRLMTGTTSLIRRELGELSPHLQSEVAARLLKLFQL